MAYISVLTYFLACFWVELGAAALKNGFLLCGFEKPAEVFTSLEWGWFMNICFLEEIPEIMRNLKTHF